MNESPTGLLVIDKPSGPTSHDIVQKVRKVLRARAGHAGTLDPQATGVLLVCLGAATRLARFLQGHDKEYEGTIRLGWATDTYDAEGAPLADPVPPPPLEAAEVEEALASFVGTIQQVPPAYSAKKMRGQPAYRRARRGEQVTPAPVTIDVYSAELTALRAEEIEVRIHCGSGTYVRTLAHDLGAALGCPAHLAGLRRTRSGSFGLERATSWEDLCAADAGELTARILPPADMLADWPTAVVGEEGATAALNGRIMEAGWILERLAGQGIPSPAVATQPQGWVRVVDQTGRMIAAGEMVPGGLVQPRVVLP